MASKPPVQTSAGIRRDKLRKVFGTDHELVKLIEDLAKDVSTTLPEASESNSAAAEAAQASANSAGTAANAAQASATAANGAASTAQGTADAAALAAATAQSTANGAAAGLAALGFLPVVVLATNVAENAAVLTDATGLVFPVLANKVYLVEALVTFRSAAVTTGIALGFALPAGAVQQGIFVHNITIATLNGASNPANATGAVTTANADVPTMGRWLIKTGATPGNAQFRFRSEVAASAVTLQAGLCVLTPRQIA